MTCPLCPDCGFPTAPVAPWDPRPWCHLYKGKWETTSGHTYRAHNVSILYSHSGPREFTCFFDIAPINPLIKLPTFRWAIDPKHLSNFQIRFTGGNRRVSLTKCHEDHNNRGHFSCVCRRYIFIDPPRRCVHVFHVETFKIHRDGYMRTEMWHLPHYRRTRGTFQELGIDRSNNEETYVNWQVTGDGRSVVRTVLI